MKLLIMGFSVTIIYIFKEFKNKMENFMYHN